MEASAVPFVVHVWPRLLVSCAVLALAWSGARAVHRRLAGPQPWDLDAVASAVLVASCVTLPALVLGTFGLLRDWTWLAGTLLGVAVLRLWAGRTPSALPRSSAGDSPPSGIFSVILAGVLIGRMVFSLRNPPADWDSLHYHLPMVAYWMQTGTLGVPLRDPPVFGSYFPGNGELLQMWAAWSTGRETLMPWMGTLGLGVLALALRRLALMAGAGIVAAEGGALCFVAAPGIMQLTLGARVDHLAAVWFAAALLFALRARGTDGRGDPVIVLGALGLLVGTKTTGVPHALLILGIVLLGAGGAARARALLVSPAWPVASLVLGGFWYARNGLATGNPFYPAELTIGPWTLPGLVNRETLWRTSQWAVWREGHAGHLAPSNLWNFFGPVLALLAVGGVLWIVGRVRLGLRPGRRSRGASRDQAVLMAALAVVCAAFFIVTPFSGAYEPARGGLPPPLNADNLRILFFTAVCALPLAAAGLSLIGSPWVVAGVLGAILVYGLAGRLGHVAPGIALAAVIAVVMNWFPVRARRLRAPAVAALIVAATAVLALAVARVEPRRDAITAGIWDGFAREIHNFPAATVRSLRAAAGGRPIACAGIDSWWEYYGRDFSGHPVYVPVGVRWEQGARPYHLVPESRVSTLELEPRAKVDRGLWLENLDRSGAVLVVVGSPGRYCRLRFEESGWCAADTVRFRPRARHLCDSAYEVVAPRDTTRAVVVAGAMGER